MKMKRGPAPKPQLIAREDAAARLGVHVRTIDALADRKEIERVHVGRRAMLRVDSLDRYIAQGGTTAAGDAA